MAVLAFKVGDLVTLRSGSPCMTVVAIEGGNYRCNWFAFAEGDYYLGELYHGTFPEPGIELWVSDTVEEDDEVTVKKFGET